MVGVRNDRRAHYTREVIQETVLSLLEKKAIGDITVTDVCKIADVNRTTFYHYYNDIFDCVDTIETEFMNSIKFERTMNPVESLHQLLTAFYQRRKVSNLILVEGKTKIFEKMQETMEGQDPDLVEGSSEYQAEFLTLGMQGIMKKWVENGMPETPAELTKIIVKIFFADNLQNIRQKLVI
jgi:AcrR family transcriptional regulator